MSIYKDCPDGQNVYSYQIICKKLGCAVGTFKDMVLKDAAGVPLKTGCDGSYGSTMLKVTNDLERKYGLPVTANGLVSDKLYGFLNRDLQALKTGVPQAQYDAVVAENGVLKTENSQLKSANAALLGENVQLKKNLKDTNNQLVLVTADRDKKKKDLEEASQNITELLVMADTYKPG